jgi:hypothetical protein
MGLGERGILIVVFDVSFGDLLFEVAPDFSSAYIGPGVLGGGEGEASQ